MDVSIGDSAFAYCSSLTSVIYCGTQEQWDAISIGSDNTPLTNATLQALTNAFALLGIGIPEKM